MLRPFRTLPFGPINSIVPTDSAPGPYPHVSDGFGPAPVIDYDLAKNPAGSVVGTAFDYRNAYAHQFNLSVQRELPWSAVLKVAYAGNLGRRLGTTYNLNQAVPITPGTTSSVNSRRPYFGVRPGLADVTYAVSDGLSNYNALQVSGRSA